MPGGHFGPRLTCSVIRASSAGLVAPEYVSNKTTENWTVPKEKRQKRTIELLARPLRPYHAPADVSWAPCEAIDTQSECAREISRVACL